MKTNFIWICAMLIMGAGGGVFGYAVGHNLKVKETVKTVTVTKEVIKEVPPPDVCLDSFETQVQYLTVIPHCPHPNQTISVTSFDRGGQREIEITCKCRH